MQFNLTHRKDGSRRLGSLVIRSGIVCLVNLEDIGAIQTFCAANDIGIGEIDNCLPKWANIKLSGHTLDKSSLRHLHSSLFRFKKECASFESVQSILHFAFIWHCISSRNIQSCDEVHITIFRQCKTRRRKNSLLSDP